MTDTIPATFSTMRPALKRAVAARLLGTQDSATITRGVAAIDAAMPRGTGALGETETNVVVILIGALVGVASYQLGLAVGARSTAKRHQRELGALKSEYSTVAGLLGARQGRV